MSGLPAAVAFSAITAMTAAGWQSPPLTLNVPGTPDHAPTMLTGCLMPGGGTTSMPGSGGSSGTGPAGMNADAANSGVFFAVHLGRKHKNSPEVSYTLVGVDPAQLKKYGNHPVEVQGTLEPAPQGSVSVATGKEKKDTPAPVFRVTAMKQVPGSCGGR